MRTNKRGRKTAEISDPRVCKITDFCRFAGSMACPERLVNEASDSILDTTQNRRGPQIRPQLRCKIKGMQTNKVGERRFQRRVTHSQLTRALAPVAAHLPARSLRQPFYCRTAAFVLTAAVSS
jgi:hypothetical protein